MIKNKRKLLISAIVLVLMLVLSTAVLAFDPIKLVVNGQELSTDVPTQLINGRTMVPVRWIAEALGAEVQWDGNTRTVMINTKSDNDQFRVKQRIDLLEQAFICSTPEETINLWADGLKTRNGALQFAQFSPELRNTYQQEFEDLNWVTGVSSPWVESYNIIDKILRADGSYEFKIVFKLETSTGWAGIETYKAAASNLGQGGADKWMITKLDKNLIGNIPCEVIADPAALLKEPGYQELSQWFDQNYKTAGMDSFSLGADKFVMISAGEKLTGGYYFEQVSTWEKQAEIEIGAKLYAPNKDAVVTQVVNYPYVLIRIQNDGKQLTFKGIESIIQNQ